MHHGFCCCFILHSLICCCIIPTLGVSWSVGIEFVGCSGIGLWLCSVLLGYLQIVVTPYLASGAICLGPKINTEVLIESWCLDCSIGFVFYSRFII